MLLELPHILYHFKGIAVIKLTSFDNLRLFKIYESFIYIKKKVSIKQA